MLHWIWYAGAAAVGSYLLFRKGKGSSGSVMPLTEIFGTGSAADKAVLASNPRLHIVSGSGTPTLVVGLPGLGDRSERFMQALANGLSLNAPYAIATIQDPRTGGPRVQGQTSTGKNTYSLRTQDYAALDNFIAKISQTVFGGPANVYIVGYSMGGLAAPKVAAKLDGGNRYKILGSVSIGSGSGVAASSMKGLRALFEVAPVQLAADKPTRSDSANRQNAEYTVKLLKKAGVEAYVLHIPTVRQQKNWHWGLISQCAYPKFDKPNPQTMAAASTFIAGGVPTVTMLPLQKC